MQQKPIVIISLGADVCIHPGCSIVGGQAVFAKELALRISKYRFCTLISLSFNSNARKNSSPNKNLNLISIEMPHSQYNATDLWIAYEEIEKEALRKINNKLLKGAFVLSVYWLSGLFLLRNFKDLSFCWLHTYSSFAQQKILEEKNENYIQIRQMYEQEIVNAANFLWTTCEYEKNFLINICKADECKILFFPRAIDSTIFNRKNRKEEPYWDILFIGRLSKRKGIYDIPPILSQLNNNSVYNIAIIGGDIEESTKYQNWFKSNYEKVYEQHNLQFFCAVEHSSIPNFLKNGKVLLVPSHYELFGNIVLEGIACGINVVACDVGGVAELIHLDNRSSVFSSGNFSDAAKLIALARTKIKNTTQIPQEFSWEYLIHSIETFFNTYEINSESYCF